MHASGCVIKTRHGTMDARRRTLLMGIIIVNAALIIFSNLAADLVYGALDPRIRYV